MEVLMSGLSYPDSGAFPTADSDAFLISRIDPQACLRGLFQSPHPLPRGAAEDAVLSWLITLPQGIDPARAAAKLGTLPPFAGVDPGTGEAGRLTALLREIARYPAEKLAASGRRRLRIAQA